MLSKTFALLGLASAASAHMIMANPVPYGSPDSSPLDASGSNFPCKGLSPDGSTTNKYKAGSSQTLSFTGSAVHGGGSCQVSLTTDKNPTRDSTWKVIHSIEGGCPAKNTEGNLPDNPDGSDPYTYDFTIPKELADGDYVLAWSWFNKIGNREMYMNCASVEVSGGGSDKSYLDSLPDMFVANVDNGCGTVEGTDVEFPNPGDSVDKFGIASALGTPTGSSCAKATGGSSPSDGGSTSEPSSTAASEPTSAAQDPSAVPTTASAGNPSPSATVPGGVFITVSTTAAPSASSTAAPSVAPSATAPSSSPEPSQPSEPAQPSPSQPSGGSGSSGGFATGTACSDEGAWNCIGGTSFQRCASGTWSETMAVAAGTTCESGQSSELKIATKLSKRKMRRSQRIRA